MSQNRIKINNVDIWQPDKDLNHSFETTYTSGSTRTQNGDAHFTPMFTVHQEEYTALDIPVAEASKILKMIIGKKFKLYYFNVYNNKWETGTFYVGKGDMKIGSLKSGNEVLSKLSFNMTDTKKLV